MPTIPSRSPPDVWEKDRQGRRISFNAPAARLDSTPVIQVRRNCLDLATGTPLAKKEPFIESLTHDSYIIQVPKLHSRHRTEVEAMLQLFDQRRIHGDRHRLAIEEAEIPERYRPLLRRLQRAVAEPEIADAMELEDEVLEELQDMERAIERERAEKEKERAEKEKERAEKEKERAEKEKERAEKEKEQAEKERLLALLKLAGIDPDA